MINIPSFFESPQNALIDAFNRRDLNAFRFALERLKADPNAVIDERSGISLFKNILSEANTVEYIDLCLQHGADLYDINQIDTKPPLIHVIDSLDPENLQIFLKNFDKSQINVKYGDGNSLHLLIKCIKIENFQNISECIKILLENGVNINTPDDHSKTPFYYLLKLQQKIQKLTDLINFILDSYAVNVHNYRSDEMISMFHKQLSHRNVPEQIEAELSYDFMRNLLTKGNENKFINNFRNYKMKNSSNFDFDDQTTKLVYEAVKIGSDECIKIMISESIDVNRKLNDAVNSPMALAASYGYYKILKLLIDTQKSIENRLIHKILHASYQNSNKNDKVNYQKCFELVLPYTNVNELDDLGNTPLHHAVHHRNHAASLDLMKNNAFIGAKNIFNESPLDEMKFEVLEEALDDRVNLIQVPEEKEQREVKICIDFNMLVSKESKFEVETLEIIAENAELRPLIMHVVISTFIYLKWKKLSLIFYTNFVIFTLLMLAFIKYIVMCHTEDDENTATLNFFKFISYFGIFLLIIRELTQLILCLNSKINYFKSAINIFEIFFIILAISSQIFDNSYIRVLRAFTILCAAFEFLHLVGELPFLSISCHMVIFQKVAFTFLKSLLLYSIILFSFALSFFILFSKNETQESTDNESDDFTNFAYPGIAVIKTFVMLTGEFDAASLSLHDKGASYCLMFLLFIFIVTIVLFNLLSALAVDDTQKIKAEGEIIDLCSRIKVLRRYEKMIFGCEKFGKLQEMINLNLRNGKIIIQPNKGYLVTSMSDESNSSETTVEIDEDESEFGCIKSKLKLTKDSKCCEICSRLDSKIGKKIRTIIEMRKEKRVKEDFEDNLLSKINCLKDEVGELKKMIKSIKE